MHFLWFWCSFIADGCNSCNYIAQNSSHDHAEWSISVCAQYREVTCVQREPQGTHFFFGYRQVHFKTETLNSDLRDCKSFTVGTDLRYAQFPFEEVT